MSMEVITTHDKDQRDRLFEDLRRNGNELERQVVKFSSNEPLLDVDGMPLHRFEQYELTGHVGKPQLRGRFRSTWSVAYPNTSDPNPSRRAN